MTLCAQTSLERRLWIVYIKSRLRPRHDLSAMQRLYLRDRFTTLHMPDVKRRAARSVHYMVHQHLGSGL